MLCCALALGHHLCYGKVDGNDPESVLDQHLEDDEVADLELVSNGEADSPLIHG